MSLYLGENLISGSKPINLGVRNIGEIVYSSLPLTDAGLHLLDGSLILGGGIYQGFVDYIADLYTENPSANYFTTEAQWQTSVTTYGVCGKFVYDSVNNTVRLPKITGIIEGTTDLTALGDLVEAGLPQHTHLIGGANSTTPGGSYSIQYPANYPSTNNYISSNASDINSIYGNSSTVQPQTIKAFYYIVIATSTKTDIQVDIDEIATDLNGKADIDLSNVPNSKGILTESYVNGNSWYRVYSDGWCEQGGNASQSVTLLKPYINTNYIITLGKMQNDNTTDNAVLQIYTKSTTGFTLYRGWGNGSGGPRTQDMWRACGYIN